jgi:hypothetical protein
VDLEEETSSCTQLIQELRADGFALVQAAPTNNDDKVMRLRSQTAKIEGQFVLFPEKAHWLDAYLLELITFPNSKHDDQVDSTVHALAWSTQEATKPGMGVFQFYKLEAAKQNRNLESAETMIRVEVPPGPTHWILITGRQVAVPPDRIISGTEEELAPVLQNGGKRVC